MNIKNTPKSNLFIAGLALFILSVTFFGIKKSSKQDQHSRVTVYAKLVSQNYKSFLEGKPSSTDRIKASNQSETKGIVGLDPWGKPYGYTIRKLASSTLITLISKTDGYTFSKRYKTDQN